MCVCVYRQPNHTNHTKPTEKGEEENSGCSSSLRSLLLVLVVNAAEEEEEAWRKRRAFTAIAAAPVVSYFCVEMRTVYTTEEREARARSLQRHRQIETKRQRITGKRIYDIYILYVKPHKSYINVTLQTKSNPHTHTPAARVR